MADRASKVHLEMIVIGYTAVWITCLGAVVHWELYEAFKPNDYLTFSLVFAAPSLLLPLLFADSSERCTPYHKRFSTKANVFIAIISYLGNHFFTHYFYNVLGMRYTGPLAPGVGIDINGVPLAMYFMTHTYFLTYHVLVTKILRCLVNRVPNNRRIIVVSLAVIMLSVVTAFIETFTISSFPYYNYPDYNAMITTGSVFYGLFLVVTFPLYYLIDEYRQWTLVETIFAALGGMMLVMLLADYWRLVFGSTVDYSAVPYS